MQTVYSVYLVLKWALELLFTVQSSGDGLLGKFTFCPSISPQRSGLIPFFFIAAYWNWFLVVYYEDEHRSAVSADTVCWIVQGETESCRQKITIIILIKKHTKKSSCSQNSSIGFPSCLFFKSSEWKPVSGLWVEMMLGIRQGHSLWPTPALTYSIICSWFIPRCC